MADKLVGKDSLDVLAKALDTRSKNRDSELQDAIDLCLVQPTAPGTDGQILSVKSDGTTTWINNSELISEEMINGYLNEIFKDETEADGEIIEMNKITTITNKQIDDIMNSVF